MNGNSANEIIDILRLKPLEIEGGLYRETYRSEEKLDCHAGLPSSADSKNLSTAIYYMLTPDTFSAIHRLPTDEIFHFYLGDPVQILQLRPDNTSEIITLGNDVFNDQHVQVIVQKGIWQGMFLKEGGSYALMGTTMSPGFEYSEYEAGISGELINLYPDKEALIRKLTKE
ncbi:cupin domain-containing protein [Candidatus Latescibacterota bacterium]